MKRLIGDKLRAVVPSAQRDQESGSSPRKHKILFALYSWFYFKNLSSAIEALAEAGHEIVIASVRHDREDFYAGVTALAAQYDNITVKTAPKRRDSWLYISWDLRQAACYIHFLHRRFDKAKWLRRRPRKRAPQAAVSMMRRWPFNHGWARALVRAVVERLEKAIPTDPAVDRFLLDEAPDVLVVSPLIDLDARLWDCLKSGLALGIPSIYAVHSWDNLSSKSQLFALPHRMLVWNEIQVKEAIDYHRVPRDLIAMTGAQVYDEWFERRPGTTKEAFCEAWGLDPDQPIILYVCSALSSELRPEPDFVKSWIEAVRACDDPAVSRANIVIRPHPKREDLWRDFDTRAFDRVAVAPRVGEMPLGDSAKTLFYDSFFHSDAVVGINTSALIEAGIVGRAVLTILARDYRRDQLQNFHFNYLMEVSGGLLMVAKSRKGHLRKLVECLHDPSVGKAKAEAFVRTFVRPQGAAQSGTELFVGEVIRVAEAGPRPPLKGRLLDPVIRLGLWPWTILPKYVELETIDSVKQPKRDWRHTHRARLIELDFRDVWRALHRWTSRLRRMVDIRPDLRKPLRRLRRDVSRAGQSLTRTAGLVRKQAKKRYKAARKIPRQVVRKIAGRPVRRMIMQRLSSLF